MLRKVLKAIAAILVAIVLIPILGQCSINVATGLGFYAAPSDFLTPAMNFFTAITSSSWFWTLLWASGGFAVGAWIDYGLKRFETTREQRYRSLGNEFTALSERIKTRQGGYNGKWPENISDLHPRILSAFLTAAPLEIWTPDNDIFDRDNPGFIIGYLALVGRLLSDGHIAQAKEMARQAKDEIVKPRASGSPDTRR